MPSRTPEVPHGIVPGSEEDPGSGGRVLDGRPRLVRPWAVRSPHAMSPIYLDHAATTPLAPEARAAMRPYLEEEFGNPSSRHSLGARAAAAVDEARAKVARALLAPPRQVVLTSGGTEAANLAVLGLARARRKHGKHVLVGATEHACVRESCAALAREGFEVEVAPLAAGGGVDPGSLAARMRPETVLVAQMLANNEFGAVYPVAALAKLVRARAPRARLVVDAVQGFGKLDCALPELGAHAVIVSAHKVHGPKGAGAAVFADDVEPEAVLHGGGQERGLRSGTENVAAIVGFGVAAELAERTRETTSRHTGALRERFVARIAGIPGLRVLAPCGPALPSIVALVIPGAPAEVRIHHLDRRGVLAGAGSACQAAKRELSPALRAIGLTDDESRCVLRFSFARTTTEAEIDAAALALGEVSRELEAVGR
jgi:cysteine desulfurase